MCFGDIFTGSTVDFFAQEYVPYCNEYPAAADRLHQTLKQNDRFRTVVRECDANRNSFAASLREARRDRWMQRLMSMQDAAKREGVEPSTTAAILASLVESADAAMDKAKSVLNNATLSLDALLLTPIQRMPRYCLLIQTMLKYTPTSHPDSFHLAHALDRLRRLTDYVNECKRDMENAARLAQMSHLIKRIPKDFYSPTRRLVRESDVMVYHGSSVGWDKGRLFMLNDAFLFTTNRLHPGKRVNFEALKFVELLLLKDVCVQRQADHANSSGSGGDGEHHVAGASRPTSSGSEASTATTASNGQDDTGSSFSRSGSTGSVTSSPIPGRAGRMAPLPSPLKRPLSPSNYGSSPSLLGSGAASAASAATDASLRTLVFSTRSSVVQVCFESADEMESWLSDAQALQSDLLLKLRFVISRDQQLVDL